MSEPHHPRLPRRTFLLGSAATIGLAACGGDSDGGAAATTTAATGAAPNGEFVLVRNFGDSVIAAPDQRLTFALGDGDGVRVTGVPETIEFQLENPEGQLTAPFTATRHDDGLPRPYYPIPVDFPAAGFYIAHATLEDGSTMDAAFQVFEPGDVAAPGIGDAFPRLSTPTAEANGGVDPICTRSPICPFHAQSLDAIAVGTPMAVLVSTPAFCQTSVCGPTLELLIDAIDTTDGAIEAVHIEVFNDDTASALAPAVEELGLVWEPSLFIVGADGLIKQRLDNVFDRTEIREALATIN